MPSLYMYKVEDMISTVIAEMFAAINVRAFEIKTYSRLYEVVDLLYSVLDRVSNLQTLFD